MAIENFLGCDNDRLNSQLLFTAEIDKMTSIARRTLLVDGSRRENDAEHSWHIAVMALIFKEYALEEPNIERVVKMLVVHDLIEIYAGDTFAYDVKGNEDKQAREKAAADKLYSILPKEQGDELRALWEEFDAMETVDAKYGACMDRIQPFLHNTLTEGHTWKDATLAQVKERMAIVKEFMPQVYEWMIINLERGVKLGWLAENGETVC